MHRFTAGEKRLLLILAVLVILVLVGAWLPESVLTQWLPEDALPVVAALHRMPYADLAALVGAMIAVVTLVITVLQRVAPDDPESTGTFPPQGAWQ